MKDRNKDKNHIGKLINVLLFALVLRLLSLNQSFWLDETTSGLVVRNLSFTEIISKFSLGDFHPPLYYLILKFWSLILGTSETALRSLSVLSGVASVYLVYKIGNIFNNKVGLISSLFLAINGLHIYYSQEARMYSISVFLVLLLIYLFLKILVSKEPVFWYLFSLTLILNAFTDYLPNLVVPVFWLYALFLKKDKEWWKRFVSAHIPLLILFIFWLPFLTKQLSNGIAMTGVGSLWSEVLGKTTAKNVLLIPIKFILGRISFVNKSLYYAISVFLVFSYSLIFLKGFKKKLLAKTNYKLILLWLIIPVLITIIIGFKIAALSYFRLIYVLPAFLIMLSVSIENLSKKWKTFALTYISLISVVSSLAYLLTPRFHRENWRELVSFVNYQSNKSDIGVVFASKGQREGYKYYHGPEIIYESGSIQSDLEKVIYIRYVQDLFDPQDSIKNEIENSGYKREKIHDFNGIIVWEYENRD